MIFLGSKRIRTSRYNYANGIIVEIHPHMRLKGVNQKTKLIYLNNCMSVLPGCTFLMPIKRIILVFDSRDHSIFTISLHDSAFFPFDYLSTINNGVSRGRAMFQQLGRLPNLRDPITAVLFTSARSTEHTNV